MSEDERTRRWQRISVDQDPLQALRGCISKIKQAPWDPEARRRLRAVAAEQNMWEQLALLLADEARAADDRPDVAAAFWEELADVHENLDQPLEQISAMEYLVSLDTAEVEHHDRLAWLYRKAGAWQKAAEAFERVAHLAQDDRSRAALRAAGTLYRENGRLDRAADVYRRIVARRPNDLDAWRALDQVLTELGRWQEVLQVRGQLAARAPGGVEKAALLRAQARAAEHAGDQSGAAELVASAALHAPDNVSGLVDLADVLARRGKGREAAEVLRERVDEAVRRGALPEDLAALRSRLAAILEDACGDRAAAGAVIEELLADMPDHVPALERLVWHAAHGPDPRAHAAALMRLGEALPDGSERTAAFGEAARRFREAGDLKSALRAFEQVPDSALELDEARIALDVDRAAADARSGEVGVAVRRLRNILSAQPHHVGANLALVDLLAPADAVSHLSLTLAGAPDDTPDIAKLVHRFALAHSATGEHDEAHQLLHEAHRLARKDLVITLALGESCFARRLWREAAIHLGALAEHPEAPRHAQGVAAGLVKAAIADVRALRPANAEKRYEAAVRIDPGCAAAWHALGELAMEKGDTTRAAECLEREASSTKNPKDRLRLFDALGDLARDVLDNATRAEYFWTQVADAGDIGVLEKLLAVQRRRGARLERAETCERLAILVTEKRARKELLEEAAQAYASGGDLTRARMVAEQLISAHPSDVDAVACASAVAMTARDVERASQWLRRALGAWEGAGDRGEGDPRRADLWRRLGDAERARGDERAAMTSYQRAVSLAPEADAALAARRGLVGLATTAGKPGGAALAALVEADHVPVDVLAWARELSRASNHDDARAMYELARGLGARIDSSDDARLDAHPVRPMASDEAYGTVLDDAERAALVDDEADAPLGAVMELLWEHASLLCPDARTALLDAGVEDARRVTSATEAAATAMFPQIAKALGGPQALLYAAPRGPDLRLLLASPPVVVLGPRLLSQRARTISDAEAASDAQLRFQLGRIVELARPRRIFTAEGVTHFARLVESLRAAFSNAPASRDSAVLGESERLKSKLPIAARRKLAERLANTTFDPATFVAGCQRAADRAGLLVCGHAGVAIEATGGASARHVVRLAANRRYLAARKKLRPRRA